jgi:hypothetical protein
VTDWVERLSWGLAREDLFTVVSEQFLTDAALTLYRYHATGGDAGDWARLCPTAKDWNSPAVEGITIADLQARISASMSMRRNGEDRTATAIFSRRPVSANSWQQGERRG